MCFSRVELRWAVSTRGKNTFSLVPGAQSWFEFRFVFFEFRFQGCSVRGDESTGVCIS